MNDAEAPTPLGELANLWDEYWNESKASEGSVADRHDGKQFRAYTAADLDFGQGLNEVIANDESPLTYCRTQEVSGEGWAGYKFYEDRIVPSAIWVHEDMFCALFNLPRNSDFLKKGVSVCEPFIEGVKSQIYYFITKREAFSYGMGEEFGLSEREALGLQIPDMSNVKSLTPFHLRVISQYMARAQSLIDIELGPIGSGEGSL